jgi:trimeric autotransporter adhesin
MRENARRTRRAGVPLREVVLADGDNDFGSDWESEGEEDVGVGSARHAARVADAVAEASGAQGSAAQSEALAVARRMARDKSQFFPEPSYDEDGRPLAGGGGGGGGGGEGAGGPAATAEAAAAKSASAPIGLAELYHGKTVDAILSEYETAMAAYADSLGVGGKASSAAAAAAESLGLGAGAGSAAAAASASPLALLDDGERAAENAYIDVCVSSGNVEALFYALLRKRDRLVRSVEGVGAAPGAPRVQAYEPALLRFAHEWGAWLNRVAVNAGGVFDWRSDEGAGKREDPYGAALVRYMDRAGVKRSAEGEDGAAGSAAASTGGAGATASAAAATEDGHATGSPGFDDRNLVGVGAAAAAVPLPGKAVEKAAGAVGGAAAAKK